MTRRLLSVVVASLLVSAIDATTVSAQGKRATSRPTGAQLSPSQLSLDEWVLLRYRGGELLPDSSARPTAGALRTVAPRVEGARSSTVRDTLVAVQFDTTPGRPSLNVGAAVRFVDSS